MSQPDGSIHRRALVAVQSLPREEWAPEIVAHVADCATCRSTGEARDEMQTRLKAAEGRRRAPSALHASVLRALEGDDPVRTASPRSRRVAWAPMAAALLAGLLLGSLVVPRLFTPSAVVDGEVRKSVAQYLDDVTHDRHLLERTGRPLEYVSNDAHATSQWLSEGLGFDVALSPRAPAGWTLEGARVWHTVSRLSALAVYGKEDARVVVFAVPATGLVFESRGAVENAADGLHLREGWGYRGVAWRQGDLAWSAVADARLTDDESLVAWVHAYRRRSGN